MSPVSPLIDWRHTPQGPPANVALNVRNVATAVNRGVDGTFGLMERLWARPGVLIAGTGLLAIAVLLEVVAHDTAVSSIVALTGCGLIVYAFVWDRLESFGPAGFKFRELKEQFAKKVEAELGDTVKVDDSLEVDVYPGAATGTGTAFGRQRRAVHGNAAAMIRAAETPEQLADVLVSIVKQQGMSTERPRPVEEDDRGRETRERD
jgi:hypothetical protein